MRRRNKHVHSGGCLWLGPIVFKSLQRSRVQRLVVTPWVLCLVITPWVLMLSALLAVAARAGDLESIPSSRLYAAVYLVRGSVAGNSIGSFGPHVRESDSTWRRISRSNVITYGFGAFGQKGSRRLYVACGNGVHQSTDDGASWKIVTGWKTMEILRILPHPDNASLLYVSTPWGIYRSEDEGRSWAQTMKGFAFPFVRHLAFDLRSADVLYATGEDDLYTTTNGGDEWRPMGVGRGSALAFLQHPRDPDLLLVGCEDRGILLSADGGRMWKPANCPSPASVYAFAVSPDGGELYAAGWETGIWRSLDRGRSWQVLWAPTTIQAFFCLLVDPNDARHLYAGTDGNGVYESFDGGGAWMYAGLNGGKIKHLFFYP